MPNRKDEKSAYRIRVQLCLALVILLFAGLFRMSPRFETGGREGLAVISESGITVDLIDITFQEAAPAAPARPSVRLPSFETPEIAEDDLDLLLDFEITFESRISQPPARPGTGGGELVARPDRRPGVLRIVEPSVPETIISRQMRFEIEVTFIISENGRVEELFISESRQFNRQNGKWEKIERLPADVLESVLVAAQQWQFRPAMHDGKPVRAQSSHLFNFGQP